MGCLKFGLNLILVSNFWHAKNKKHCFLHKKSAQTPELSCLGTLKIAMIILLFLEDQG